MILPFNGRFWSISTSKYEINSSVPKASQEQNNKTHTTNLQTHTNYLIRFREISHQSRSPRKWRKFRKYKTLEKILKKWSVVTPWTFQKLYRNWPIPNLESVHGTFTIGEINFYIDSLRDKAGFMIDAQDYNGLKPTSISNQVSRNVQQKSVVNLQYKLKAYSNFTTE